MSKCLPLPCPFPCPRHQDLWTSFLCEFVVHVVRQPVTVVGNSIGGFVAASLAGDHPSLVHGVGGGGSVARRWGGVFHACVSTHSASTHPEQCSRLRDADSTICHPHTLFSAGLVLVNSAGKVEPGYVAPEKTYSDVAQSGSPLLSPTLINLVSSVRGLAKGWGKGAVLDNRIDVLDILMKRVSCPSHFRGSSGCSRGTSSGS